MAGFGRKGLGTRIDRLHLREKHASAQRAFAYPTTDVSELAETYSTFQSPPERSLTKAYLLWLFLGQFSAHRFYLGRVESACAQIALALVGLMLYFDGPPKLGGLLLKLWVMLIISDVFRISQLHRDFGREAQDGGFF